MNDIVDKSTRLRQASVSTTFVPDNVAFNCWCMKT